MCEKLCIDELKYSDLSRISQQSVVITMINSEQLWS